MRTTFNYAFDTVGADFGRSFNVKAKIHYCTIRTFTKSYLALFICLKTVHLERVNSLSTVSFVAILKHFIARRGCPSVIFRDNGTNLLERKIGYKTFTYYF